LTWKEQIDAVAAAISPSASGTPRATRWVETDRNVEDFLENHLEAYEHQRLYLSHHES
jgi:hypothetical protein